MASAQRSACAVCNASSSKYTCPYCQAATCSLACFGQHKASEACSSARKQHEYTSKYGPPVSLLTQPVSRFVPMKEYDYNQMLEDYQFLNQVGRMVTERGRELSNGKMLAPEKPAAGPSSRHGPAAQQRREALGKQIAFHKLPIMLVPDGMSRRKQNRSHWDAKYVLIPGLTYTDSGECCLRSSFTSLANAPAKMPL